MFIWLIIIAIMVVALTVLVLLRKSKVASIESFANAPGSNSSAPSFNDFLASIGPPPNVANTLQNSTTNFLNSQMNYGQNVLGKEVLTNAVMPNFANMPMYNTNAVNVPDIYLNSPENVIVKQVENDNNSQFTNADIQWCKSAAMPANLPPHVRGAAVGCGWYYIPDPNMPSSGALGQIDGPIYPNGQNNDGVNGIPHYGNGQWVWDLALAQQLEEIKNCARIKACIAIDAPSVQGKCGFCTDAGHAIPANRDGSERYTQSKTVGGITAPAATCNSALIMTGAACAGPAPPPYVSPQGINCGNYGFPSDDYSLRLYTSSECKDSLQGNFNPADNTCMDQSGNSFSAYCAPLNGVKPSPNLPVCTPDSNGRLSKACLITLAQSVGLTSGGSIIQMLQTGSEPGQLDKVAIQIMKGQNVPVNPVLYQGGAILTADAIAAYDNIYGQIQSGSEPVIQQAAMWLCIGTNNFDPCDLPEGTPGPFFTECIQQQWRIAGCQPAGTQYPSQQSTLDALNTLTWGAVKSMFAGTYSAMNSGNDPVQQDIAVQRCLGITTQRPPATPCVSLSRDSLIINLDNSAFKNPDTASAYTMKGTWPSANGVFIGNFIANGTKVSDSLGVQFDGTTVLGSPNLVDQVLNLPLSRSIVNGPDPSTVTSVPPSPPPSPGYIHGDWVAGGILPGVPIANKALDDKGNTVYMIFDDIYTKMVNSNGVAKYYVGPNSQYDASKWPSYNDAGNHYQLSAPSGTFSFDENKPILTAAGKLGDCGYPPGAIGINGDGQTRWSIAFNSGVNPVQSPDGTMPTLVDQINAIVKDTSSNGQSLAVTITTDSGLSWSGPITSAGNGGWLFFLNGTGPSPIAPNGTYYFPQNNGNNYPPFQDWDSATGMNCTLSVNVSLSNAETRELWINPTTDTCEILAILTGPSYSQSYTAMAINKGQLVIALQSIEKGYTFFTCGKIAIGQWSHIVHSYRDGVNQVWINGAGPVSPPSNLTRASYNGYLGYSLGGGSRQNPLYQRAPTALPFQGEIGAFRVYSRAFNAGDVQTNLSSTIDTYVNQVQLATKNDPNALAMAAGQFYVPSLNKAINYQPRQPGQ